MSELDLENEGLDPECEAALGELRADWRPTATSRADDFGRDLAQRIRHRRLRNRSLVALVLSFVGILVGGIFEGESAPPASSELSSSGAPALASDQSMGSVGQVPSSGVARSPLARNLVLDGASAQIGPTEVEVWFREPLGASPDPTEWSSEYAALGALYLSEVPQ